MGTAKKTLDKLDFESLRRAIETPERLVLDPLGAVPRDGTLQDQELSAFIAAGLAFGNVVSIQRSVRAAIGAYVVQDGSEFVGHRWVRTPDVAALNDGLRTLQAKHGSLGTLFSEGYEAGDMRNSLSRFSSHVRSLLPTTRGAQYLCSTPDRGSACKRMNLFLRWMVRRDGVDLGLWPTVSPADLISPLDVHVLRFAQHHGLTKKKVASWAAAEEVTGWFRRRWPEDPMRYDFAISHSGMMRLDTEDTA